MFKILGCIPDLALHALNQSLFTQRSKSIITITASTSSLISWSAPSGNYVLKNIRNWISGRRSDTQNNTWIR